MMPGHHDQSGPSLPCDRFRQDPFSTSFVHTLKSVLPHPEMENMLQTHQSQADLHDDLHNFWRV
jgi:hypothetical protein